MPAPLIPPKFRAFTQAGLPLNGGKLYSYVAGTTTPLATYPTSADATAATNANANPTVLDANGEANVWLTSANYKFVLKDSTDVTQWTVDNVSESGVSTAASTTSEWLQYSAAPTYISATQFTVAGDQTSTFVLGRRVKTTNTAGTSYGTVTAAVFGAVTTVTVYPTNGSLDSGLSSVSYSILSAPNTSIPKITDAAVMGTTVTAGATTTWKSCDSSAVYGDVLGEITAGTGFKWTAAQTGIYLFTASFLLSEGAATTGISAQQQSVGFSKNGAAPAIPFVFSWPFADSLARDSTVPAVQAISLVAGDYIQPQVKMTFTGTAPTFSLYGFSVRRIY